MKLDFEALGFKAGLEVHQQLETGKLFSRTPSVLVEGKPDIVVRRKLRASASEMGEYDSAALEAVKKGHSYAYQAFAETISLVELDEEPPQDIDKEAFETAIMVAMMCDSATLDKFFVMRKIVLDGSNTSAFQRTALVSLGGNIDLGNKKIGIQTIALEEDSARPVEKTGKEVVYSLDRLGIPLIELATEPGLKNPQELKTAAKKIGEIFRLTCKAKRGLGSIRQDLNVSIKGGARVEIKGVQELEMIDAIAEREVQRQLALLGIKKSLEERGTKKTELNDSIMDISSVFQNTQSNFLNGKKVFGIRARKFSGLLGKELQPGRRLGTELSVHVREKTSLRGIIHSDELPAYGITESETGNAAKALGCSGQDGFVLVAGESTACREALETARERLQQCLEGVPEETRNVLADCNTEYSRPLPGAARMYPETDLPPIIVGKKSLSEIKKRLPKSVAEREKLYRKMGLSEKLVDELKLSNSACFFEELIEKNINPKTAAVLLVEGLIQLKREGITNISFSEIEEVLLAEKNGKVPKDILLDVFRKIKKENKTPPQAISELSGKKMGAEEIRREVIAIIEKNKRLVKEKGPYAISALMGEVMKKMAGKAPGSVVSTILKEELEKKH